MAKQLSFPDPQLPNQTLPTTYWKIVQINISIADKAATILFYGYASKAASQASPPGVIVGQKFYSLSGVDYTNYISSVLAHAKDPIALGYDTATGTKDVVVDPKDTTKNISFFETALDV